ncbi:hypothetical protein H6792_02635 [Candidatus Nomurabacteria bacterium]|nr:hypothetical protein [Candidatus Nomurabacteria bacterium]
MSETTTETTKDIDNPTRQHLLELVQNLQKSIAMTDPPVPFKEQGLADIASENDKLEYQLEYLEKLRQCVQAALWLALIGKLKRPEDIGDKSNTILSSVVLSAHQLAHFIQFKPDRVQRFSIDPQSFADLETRQRFTALQEAVQAAVDNSPESPETEVMRYLLELDPHSPESLDPTPKWFGEFLNQHPELASLDPIYCAAILTNAAKYQEAIDSIKGSQNLTVGQKRKIINKISTIQLTNPSIPPEDVSTQIRELVHLNSSDQDLLIAKILVNRASNDPSISIENVSTQIRGLVHLNSFDQDLQITEILVNRASNDPSISIENVSTQIRGLKELTPGKQDLQIARILINRASNDLSISIEDVSTQIRGLKKLTPERQDLQIARILINRASNDLSISIEDVSDQIDQLEGLDDQYKDWPIIEINENRAARNLNTKITDIDPNNRYFFLDYVLSNLYDNPPALQQLLLEYTGISEVSVSQ